MVLPAALRVVPFAAGINQRWANKRESNLPAVGMTTQVQVYPMSRGFLDDFGGVNEEEGKVVLGHATQRAPGRHSRSNVDRRGRLTTGSRLPLVFRLHH